MDQSQYAEYSVRVKQKGWLPFAYLGLGIVFLIGFIMMFENQWAFILPSAVVIALFVGNKHTRLEYEYVFVTDEIAFDKIYSGSLRKRALKVEMSDVESIEPTNVHTLEQKKRQKNASFKDFTSHEKGVFNYTMTYYVNGKTAYLLFEPDEHILQLMKKVAPRKVTIAEVRKPV